MHLHQELELRKGAIEPLDAGKEDSELRIAQHVLPGILGTRLSKSAKQKNLFHTIALGAIEDQSICMMPTL